MSPMTPRAMSAGVLLGSPMPNRSKGRGQTKLNFLVSRLGVGQMPNSLIVHSQRCITETRNSILTHSVEHGGCPSQQERHYEEEFAGIPGMRHEPQLLTERGRHALWRPYEPRGMKKLVNR